MEVMTLNGDADDGEEVAVEALWPHHYNRNR